MGIFLVCLYYDKWRPVFFKKCTTSTVSYHCVPPKSALSITEVLKEEHLSILLLNQHTQKLDTIVFENMHIIAFLRCYH